MLQNDFDNQHNQAWRIFDRVLTVQTVIGRKNMLT